MFEKNHYRKVDFPKAWNMNQTACKFVLENLIS